MLSAILFALLSGADASPLPPANVTTHVSSPRGTGQPHDCAEAQYPVSALQSATEGNTVMKFTVTAEGHVRDVSVVTSSGNADLDAAAVTCASTWLYKPGLKDGAPVDMPWMAQVKWQIGIVEPYSSLIGAAKSCLWSDPVGLSELKKAPFRPVVRVHFSGGAITEIVSAGSTGDADLDTRTIACYRGLPPDLSADVPDGERLLVIMKPGE